MCNRTANSMSLKYFFKNMFKQWRQNDLCGLEHIQITKINNSKQQNNMLELQQSCSIFVICTMHNVFSAKHPHTQSKNSL